MKYDAFISYAHGDDTRIAKALQENLQRLAKRWDSLSAIRVFRDATHLPMTSLEPAIVAALGESKFLILIASPESAASEWVRQELAHFLETHTPERVLIVLVGGDLVWDGTAHRFAPGPASAAPHVEAMTFENEPVYLDLRWAPAAKDLSLTNPLCLDAAATLAASLQDIGKETLVGELIEEQRRLRRNQRINLGFRGAAGFGVAATAMFVVGAAFSFTSSAVLSPAMGGYLYFVLGMPAIGAFGALCCGLGWRGVLGFAAGFLVLLPLYAMGSLQPFESSRLDYSVMTAMCLVGFLAAGVIGAAASGRLRWVDGAIAFAIGGAVMVVAWPVWGEFRPAGIHTALMAWPWQAARFGLLAQAAREFAAGVFDNRDTGMLIPLIAGVSIAGLGLGIRVADARMRGFAQQPAARSGRVSAVLRRFPVPTMVSLAVILGIVSWSWMLRDQYQVDAAVEVLGADSFRGLLTGGTENMDAVVEGRVLPLALRTRNALVLLHKDTGAAELSRVIGLAVDSFAAVPGRYYNRYRALGLQTPDLADVAGMLKDYGQPGELTHFLDAVAGSLSRASSLDVIAAARMEAAVGSKARAAEFLHTASVKMDTDDDWFTRSLLARAFYEVGEIDSAKSTLRKLGAEITTLSSRERGIVIGVSDRLAPESGLTLLATGVWNELPAWREELGEPLADAIEDLCRRGVRDSVVMLITTHRKDIDRWHTQERLARAAAQARQYETAFAALDAFTQRDNPGGTDFGGRVEGLTEIIDVAATRGDTATLRRAIRDVREAEQTIRKRSGLKGSGGVAVANAYAIAGLYDDADRVARDVTEDPWEATLDIGVAESKARHRAQAASRLADAWRGFQEHPSADERHEALAEIGTALASIGELKAARNVAYDIGSDFGHYSGGLEAASQLSIYVAVLEYAARAAGANR